MSLKEDFIGKNVEKQSLLPTIFFLNLKMCIWIMKKCKKKHPGTDPVPGLKVIFRIKIVVNKVDHF